MNETGNKGTGTRIVSARELRSPHASSIIGQVLAELPAIPAERLGELPTHYRGKQTHKASEPKSKPRSYRFAVSVERKMKKAQRKLRVNNQTTFVEAAIIAACRKLGVS